MGEPVPFFLSPYFGVFLFLYGFTCLILGLWKVLNFFCYQQLRLSDKDHYMLGELFADVVFFGHWIVFGIIAGVFMFFKGIYWLFTRPLRK